MRDEYVHDSQGRASSRKMNARFSRSGGNLKFAHTSLLEIAYEMEREKD